MSTMQIPTRQDARELLRDIVRRLRRLETLPPRAVFEIKLFADAAWSDSVSIVVTGDGRFILSIAEELDGAYLLKVQIYLTTAGSGDTSVMVRNATTDIDMLNDAVVIPAGEKCAVSIDIDPDNQQVSGCDEVALDVDAAGGGDAKGLGAILTFGGFAPGGG